MLNAKDLAIVDNAVKQMLQEIKKYSPDDYKKLGESSHMASVMDVAKSAATEEVLLSKELAGEPSNIEELLLKNLPHNRILLIKGGLEIPTFRMDITKKDDGNYWVDITEDRKALHEPRMLTSIEDIEWATILQWASIVVECVMLVMSAIGISVSPGEHAISEAVEDAAKVIKESSQFQRAIEGFVEAWDSAGASAYQKAKAIFYLLKDTYSAGILWTIIKSICKNMSWVDWLKTVGEVTAMIIAAFATEGIALIAKIALIVNSAVSFGIKIANLKQLKAIQKTL